MGPPVACLQWEGGCTWQFSSHAKSLSRLCSEIVDRGRATEKNSVRAAERTSFDVTLSKLVAARSLAGGELRAGSYESRRRIRDLHFWPRMQKLAVRFSENSSHMEENALLALGICVLNAVQLFDAPRVKLGGRQGMCVSVDGLWPL